MTLKAIDKQYESFSTGDKVVNVAGNDIYGVEVIQVTWVPEIGEYLYIVAEGDVKNGKWVRLTKSGTGTLALKARTVEQLRKYNNKWTPGSDFKPGDVLKDQDGVMYFVASSESIWNLTKGTKTTLARWQATGTNYGGRKFTLQTTASGNAFSSFLEVKDLYV